MQIYINGNLNAQKANATGLTRTSNAALTLGYTQQAGGGYYLSGAMDDARVFNRALTATEIANMYQSTNGYYTTGDLQKKAQSTTVQDGLMGRWSLDTR